MTFYGGVEVGILSTKIFTWDSKMLFIENWFNRWAKNGLPIKCFFKSTFSVISVSIRYWNKVVNRLRKFGSLQRFKV